MLGVPGFCSGCRSQQEAFGSKKPPRLRPGWGTGPSLEVGNRREVKQRRESARRETAGLEEGSEEDRLLVEDVLDRGSPSVVTGRG